MRMLSVAACLLSSCALSQERYCDTDLDSSHMESAVKSLIPGATLERSGKDRIVLFDPVMKMDILIVAGKLRNVDADKRKSFVAIMSCNAGEFVLERRHTFFAEKIEGVVYDENKGRAAVVFRFESEEHGWLTWGSNYDFEMFADPEL